MKVNFCKPFKAYDGKDAEMDKEVISTDGKKVIVTEKQMINDFLALHLFNGAGLERTGKADTDNQNKYVAYKLSQKIIAAKGIIEISVEEAAIVKQVASSMNPGGYAQIVDLIEGD